MGVTYLVLLQQNAIPTTLTGKDGIPLFCKEWLFRHTSFGILMLGGQEVYIMLAYSQNLVKTS